MWNPSTRFSFRSNKHIRAFKNHLRQLEDLIVNVEGKQNRTAIRVGELAIVLGTHWRKRYVSSSVAAKYVLVRFLGNGSWITPCRGYIYPVKNETHITGIYNGPKTCTDMHSFRIRQKYYLRIHGTSMITLGAPTYANIFVEHLETTFLSNSMHRPHTYLGYIDNVLNIWEHGLEQLNHFIEVLNKIHPTIKTYTRTLIHKK